MRHLLDTQTHTPFDFGYVRRSIALKMRCHDGVDVSSFKRHAHLIVRPFHAVIDVLRFGVIVVSVDRAFLLNGHYIRPSERQSR